MFDQSDAIIYLNLAYNIVCFVSVENYREAEYTDSGFQSDFAE